MPELPADVLQDETAMSLAVAVTVAKRRAQERGIDLLTNAISASQQPADDRFFWRINFGPKNPVGRRGGGLIIDVDPLDGSIREELRGQ